MKVNSEKSKMLSCEDADLLKQYKLQESLTKNITGKPYKLKDLKTSKCNFKVQFYDKYNILYEEMLKINRIQKACLALQGNAQLSSKDISANFPDIITAGIYCQESKMSFKMVRDGRDGDELIPEVGCLIDMKSSKCAFFLITQQFGQCYSSQFSKHSGNYMNLTSI